MLLLYSAITAFFLASGQTLWKLAANSYPHYLELGNSKALAGIKVLASVNFIFGAILYVGATLVYLWLFSKYPFFQVQLSLVTFSIIFATLISRFFFKESLSLVNLLGTLILIIGVYLVIWKRS